MHLTLHAGDDSASGDHPVGAPGGEHAQLVRLFLSSSISGAPGESRGRRVANVPAYPCPPRKGPAAAGGLRGRSEAEGTAAAAAGLSPKAGGAQRGGAAVWGPHDSAHGLWITRRIDDWLADGGERLCGHRRDMLYMVGGRMGSDFFNEATRNQGRGGESELLRGCIG